MLVEDEQGAARKVSKHRDNKALVKLANKSQPLKLLLLEHLPQLPIGQVSHELVVVKSTFREHLAVLVLLCLQSTCKWFLSLRIRLGIGRLRIK